MSERIIFCEPEQRGLTHLSSNTALLKTTLLAYPDCTLVFMGESSHVAAVSEMLSTIAPEELQRVEWKHIEIPRRDTSPLNVMLAERAWCRHLLNEVESSQPRFVLLSSITDSSLLVLKLSMLKRHTRTPVVAVPHGILSTLEGTQSTKMWRRFINLRLALRLPQPPALRLIALGDSIYAHVKLVAPKLCQVFRPMDLTYQWDRNTIHTHSADETVCFGFFGVTSHNKGFEQFHNIALNINRDRAEAAFCLVGFVRDPEACATYKKAVGGITSTPLPPDEYARRADALTYCIWTGNSEHYRLTASSSFLDALSFVKPGIYLRNPYIETYFEKMGDIGYLCGSYDEMLQVVTELSQDFPQERYRQQCDNILKGRALFEPNTLAPRLRAIVEEIELELNS